jgi:hypothetical protein
MNGNKTTTFTFRLNPAERETISWLAERLQRSDSDAVRTIVMTTARELKQSANTIPAESYQPALGAESR